MKENRKKKEEERFILFFNTLFKPYSVSSSVYGQLAPKCFITGLASPLGLIKNSLVIGPAKARDQRTH